MLRTARCWNVRWCSSVPQVLKDYLSILGENSVDVVELMSNGEDVSAEVKKLGNTFELSTRYGNLMKSAAETRQISEENSDLAEMAEEELKEMESEIHDIQTTFDDILQIRDEADDLDVIIETQGGVGGLEGDLFAEELLNQYKVFAKNQGWNWTTLALFDPETSLTEAGEERCFRAKISGEDVFRLLKWESGVHRVQRVPQTESGGRVHTSTAGVKVFPVFGEIVQTKFKTTDFHFKSMRNTGPGGQGVNSTNSAAQVTHRETGLTVREFALRGYELNRDLAIDRLCAMLWQLEQEEALKVRGEAKASLAFSLDRFNRLRTYNWGRQSVHDHRLKTDHTINLDMYFDGDGEGILYFTEALQALDMSNRREEWIKDQIVKQREMQTAIKLMLSKAAAA